ncbi:MAG: hypothetical protein ACLVAT_02555 [Lachnospiraceae bacterium]
MGAGVAGALGDASGGRDGHEIIAMTVGTLKGMPRIERIPR